MKFYNEFSKNFIKSSLNQINSKYGANVKFIKNFDKGLNENIFSEANVILFDQPGTGFLECLTYDVPVMVLWKRNFCEPNSISNKYFNNLAKVGIIHYNEKSLISEYKKFLSNKS